MNSVLPVIILVVGLVTSYEALVPCVPATTLGGTPIVVLTLTIIKSRTSISWCGRINNFPILAHQR